MNIILSNFFTSRIDPQHGIYHSANDYSKIEKWHKSILGLDLNYILFTDFNGSIPIYHRGIYTYVNLQDFDKDNKYSLNDIRYFIFKEVIEKNNFDKIIIMDCFDAEIVKNPFDIITEKNKIYCGTIGTWGNNTALNKKFPVVTGWYRGTPVYAPGVVGAYRKPMIEFLDLLIRNIKSSSIYNNNIQSFNIICNDEFRKNIMFGNKLVSFLNKESDCCIRHK